MLKPEIPLSSPEMGGNELPFIQNAFDTNWVGMLGPNVDLLETELQKYLSGDETDSRHMSQSGAALGPDTPNAGRVHVAALSSGTTAMHLALVLLGIKSGDVVICQNLTSTATADPILYQRAIPVLVDSEPDTWNMDPQSLEMAINACLTGRVTGHPVTPKAIIAVHLFGMPAKIASLVATADKYGIPVIEDAAHALGSSVNGKMCGTFGRLGVLSFGSNKIITASGGGVLVSGDEALIAKARFYATQARDKARHYQHSEIGYNYRISNIVASVGCAQMQILGSNIEARRNNFKRYLEYFKELNSKGYSIQVQNEQESHSNRWLTTILIDPATNKGITAQLLHEAMQSASIQTRPVMIPLHKQPLYEKYSIFSAARNTQVIDSDKGNNETNPQIVGSSNGSEAPGETVSETFSHQGLSLPSSSGLKEEEWTRIFEVLGEVFKNLY